MGIRPSDIREEQQYDSESYSLSEEARDMTAADHIGYEWTGRAHGSLADALATLAVQRWLEQWLVAE